MYIYKMGIIYLIQPKELFNTNRFKVGCSTKNDNSRIKNGYKKGTEIFSIFMSEMPFRIEKIIKYIFKIKYDLIAGQEYFEGNKDDIIDTFNNINNLFLNKKTEKNNDVNHDKYISKYICVDDYLEKYKEQSKKYIISDKFVINKINSFLDENIIKTNDKKNVIKISDIYNKFYASHFFPPLKPKDLKIYNKKFFHNHIITHTNFREYYKIRNQNTRHFLLSHSFV